MPCCCFFKKLSFQKCDGTKRLVRIKITKELCEELEFIAQRHNMCKKYSIRYLSQNIELSMGKTFTL